jgi:hypothetical protein
MNYKKKGFFLMCVVNMCYLQDARAENFEELLTNRVRRALSHEIPLADEDEEANEEKLSSLVVIIAFPVTAGRNTVIIH